MDAPASILLLNVTRIGDTLAATPVIRALHRQWPHAAITALGSPRAVEVLENLPGIAAVGHITKKRALLRGYWGGESYDLALAFNFDTALIAYALRVARKVVAFRQQSEALNARLYRCVDPAAYETVHITEHSLRLAVALGIREESCRIDYRCRAEEVAAAEQGLQQAGLAGRRPLVGLQVASFATKSYRDWPTESFLALCKALAERWPEVAFLIYGGTEEKQRTEWLKAQLGARALLLAGRLSLRETAAMMSRTDLYVGVDTGPTHLMSSFDIPIIGLYHPRHRAINLGPRDHPCNFSLDHPHDDDLDGEPRPMSDITVEQVLARALEALASRGYA